MASEKLTKEQCIELLRDKNADLLRQAPSRYPERGDFTSDEVVAIKAFLGPWPRALETAGIKPANEERLSKKIEKRVNAKRKKTIQKIENKE